MKLPKLIAALLFLEKEEREELLGFVKRPPYQFNSKNIERKLLKKLVGFSDEELMAVGQDELHQLYKEKSKKAKQYHDREISKINSRLVAIILHYQQGLAYESSEEEHFPHGFQETALALFYYRRLRNARGTRKNSLQDNAAKFLKDLEKQFDEAPLAKQRLKPSYLSSRFLFKRESLRAIDLDKADERLTHLEEMQELVHHFSVQTQLEIDILKVQILQKKPQKDEEAQLALEETARRWAEWPLAPDHLFYFQYLCLQVQLRATLKRMKTLFEYLQENPNSAGGTDAWRTLLNESRKRFVADRSEAAGNFYLAVFRAVERSQLMDSVVGSLEEIEKLYSSTIVLLSQNEKPHVRALAREYYERFSQQKGASAIAQVVFETMVLFSENQFEAVQKRTQDSLYRENPQISFNYKTIMRILDFASFYELNNGDIERVEQHAEKHRQYLSYHAEDKMASSQAKRLKIFTSSIKKMHLIRSNSAHPEKALADAQALQQELQRQKQLPYHFWLMEKVEELLG